MRVVHVNDIAYVGSTLTRALRGLGVDAELVEPPRPGAGLPYPWKVAALPLRVGWILVSGLGLRRRHVDLVHVHYARLGMFGPLSGRPYVLHCHGTDVRGVTPGSIWGREAAPWLARASLVLYSTPDLQPWVEAFRPDASFLPNPVDLPPDATVVPDTDLLVGVRLNPIKGVDEIAATLEAVVRSRPATTLTILDQGRDVERIRAISPSRSRVVPVVPHADLPALSRRHRIAIGQLAVGAIGNYELEAMAVGRPVVAAFRYPDAYPAPPPLVDAVTAEARAAEIVRLLDDDGARAALGAASLAWVTEHHAAESVARRLLAEYRALLGEPG